MHENAREPHGTHLSSSNCSESSTTVLPCAGPLQRATTVEPTASSWHLTLQQLDVENQLNVDISISNDPLQWHQIAVLVMHNTLLQ